MARPLKRGLDYFPLDVNIFEDEKIAAISGEFKLKGEIIVIKLLCAIYRNGYFYEWNEMNRMYLLKQLPGVTENLLTSVVQRLVRWGFFDKGLFDSPGVLTSVGIQERYFSAISRRSRKKEDYPYLLIKNSVIADKNQVSASKNPVQLELLYTETPQRKGKEIKTPHNLPASGEIVQGFSDGQKDKILVFEDGVTRYKSLDDGVKRNYAGLLDWLSRNEVPAGVQSHIVSLCNYGEIGHPVWRYIAEVEARKSKIKMPGSYVLARLKNSLITKDIIDSEP